METDMDTLEAIFTRRSTRKLRKDPVPHGLVEKILEAGRVAPCGGNSQTTHFIVIENQQILEALSEIVCQAFAGMEVKKDTYKSLRKSIIASKRGDYVFHYGAPVLVVTANKTGYGNAMADSACALENMMIAANALDLGSCYINQLHWLTDNDTVRGCMEDLGLSQDEFITGGLILGYPDTADGKPLRNKKIITGNPVTWIN